MSSPSSINEGEWGKFIRENFDKFLLIALFLGLVVLVVHLVHDVRDENIILWGREMAGTVLGALLGLITGHALASRTIAKASGATGDSTITTDSKG